MKILVVSDYYQPKLPYAKERLSQEFIRLGHTVTVLTSDRFFPFHSYNNTVASTLGPRIITSGIFQEDGITVIRKKPILEMFSRVFFIGIRSHIETYKPDVVVVFGIASPSAIQVANAKTTENFRLILADSHLPSELHRGASLLLTAKSFLYWIFRVCFSSKIEKKADKIVAQQDATVQVIRQAYGIKNKPITIVPNGTDTQVYRFLPKWRKKLRKKIGIPESDFVIIYTGKVVSSKGIEILMAAFSALSLRHKDIWCVLVGNGPDDYRKHCLSQVSKNAKKRVRSIPFQPQNVLAHFYSMADVAVWPLQESLSMNDAASCERVFIANDTMGDNIRTGNNNAVLYKKGNAPDLAKKIESLYLNPKARKEMGKRGRALMVKKLSWPKLAHAFLQ